MAVVVWGCDVHGRYRLNKGEAPLLHEGANAAAFHEPFMRQCFQLATNAGKKGNHAFGALLVHDGRVILTAENTVYTENDPYRHAELNLIARARREFEKGTIRQSTLYTSTAPCMVCSAAMLLGGITRVVYGVSYEGFEKLTGLTDNSIPCPSLYRQTGVPLEWIGPVLEEEGLQVFRHWPGNDPHSHYFRK